MWEGVINFFDSSFFLALTTGLSAGAAIWVYKSQKRETKERAAIVLINEIRNAESAIQTVKDALSSNPNTVTLPEITVLPENNWKKFADLFSKDFDQDEIKLINKFYSDVERVSYIVTQANNMFIINVLNRASSIQFSNLNIIAGSNASNVKQMVEEFEDRLWRKEVSPSLYFPKGFTENLNKYLPDISFVLSTNVGEKLKKIARGSRFLHIFH